VSSLDEPVHIEAYNPEWPLQFEREASRLREVIGDAVRGIEHVGSTAVVGLAAKPVIDVMIGVFNLDRAGELASRLTTFGYEDCER
jgi:GrpB-like predicted nucleotidyltransferase (UPF0157 family)